MEMDIEEVRKIRTRREKKGEMVVVKLRSKENKWNIIEGKNIKKNVNMDRRQ